MLAVYMSSKSQIRLTLTFVPGMLIMMPHLCHGDGGEGGDITTGYKNTRQATAIQASGDFGSNQNWRLISSCETLLRIILEPQYYSKWLFFV